MALRLPVQRLFLPSSTRPHIQRFRPLISTKIRTMASSTGTYEFLVVVPDKPGADVRAKRLQVRAQHFADLQPNIKTGNWKMGGALLNEVPADDDASKFDFAGSTIVLVAESKADVLSTLEKDIYATSGVWDLEKVQIYPFKCAFRFE